MVFEKNCDNLAYQYKINKLTPEQLQKLFDVDQSNHMFDCFPVAESQKEAIEKDTGVPMDFSRFDYFISAETAD
jgi:hypothetical protein